MLPVCGIFSFFFNKVIVLVGGGSVINGATPSSCVNNGTTLRPALLAVLVTTITNDVNFHNSYM